MSYYKDQLNIWLKKLNIKADRVLDLGGGENPVKSRVALWEVNDYKILDNDIRFKPDILADINYPLNEKIRASKYRDFDIVFCLEVAEYVWSPITFHKNIWDLLKPGGIAYISYPTIYPLHNPVGIDYLRYSKNAIEKLLTEVGFKTWEIAPRVATRGKKALATFYQLEGMHPIKRDDSIFDIGYMVKVSK